MLQGVRRACQRAANKILGLLGSKVMSIAPVFPPLQRPFSTPLHPPRSPPTPPPHLPRLQSNRYRPGQRRRKRRERVRRETARSDDSSALSTGLYLPLHPSGRPPAWQVVAANSPFSLLRFLRISSAFVSARIQV